MERETMRSITDGSLCASLHQEPVPSQVTAAGSCAQVTRPGTTPRGIPIGERGSNKEGRTQVAAAIDRGNCRRVISILTLFLNAQDFMVSPGWIPPEGVDLEMPSELYLTAQIEFSLW